MASTYSIVKTSESVASLVVPAHAMTLFTVTFTKLTAKTYVWAAATSDVTITTDDGTVVDNGDGTFSVNALGTYSIAFASDGVYKIGVVITGTGAGIYTHYTLINATLKALLKTQITNNIYCHPDVAYDCSDKIDAVYNTNILSIISNSYFVADINVAFDYADQTTGLLYEGYQYECTIVSSGSGDFAAGTTLLLMDSSFNTLAASTDVVLNTVYTCIVTGTPDAWDAATLSPMTTELTARFNEIADAIDRVNEYSTSCAVLNICQ